MPSDPKIRASDEDRDRTAALLREHHAAGGSRWRSSTSASTRPMRQDVGRSRRPAGGSASHRLVSASRRLAAPRAGRRGRLGLPWWRPPGALMAAHGRFSPAWRAAWGSWLSITSICFVVWLVTGGSLTNPWSCGSSGRGDCSCSAAGSRVPPATRVQVADKVLGRPGRGPGSTNPPGRDRQPGPRPDRPLPAAARDPGSTATEPAAIAAPAAIRHAGCAGTPAAPSPGRHP